MDELRYPIVKAAQPAILETRLAEQLAIVLRGEGCEDVTAEGASVRFSGPKPEMRFFAPIRPNLLHLVEGGELHVRAEGDEVVVTPAVRFRTRRFWLMGSLFAAMALIMRLLPTPEAPLKALAALVIGGLTGALVTLRVLRVRPFLQELVQREVERLPGGAPPT